LPENNSWKKNKNAKEVKNTFDDAVPVPLIKERKK
jgi:hypothetical protein